MANNTAGVIPNLAQIDLSNPTTDAGIEEFFDPTYVAPFVTPSINYTMGAQTTTPAISPTPAAAQKSNTMLWIAGAIGAFLLLG